MVGSILAPCSILDTEFASAMVTEKLSWIRLMPGWDVLLDPVPE